MSRRQRRAAEKTAKREAMEAAKRHAAREKAAAKREADAKAKGEEYDMDTLWGYSKSGPSKDKYKSLIKVATFTVIQNEKTGQMRDFELKNP